MAPIIPMIGSALLLAVLVQAGPARAQNAASSNVEPGKIENRIRKPATSAPTSADEKPAAIPALPTMDLKPDGIEGQFVLAGVEIIGATVYPVADFAPLYEPLMASQVSLAQIQALVKAVTQKYRDDGYFLATASAEPQDLALGILRIRIAEGAITRVRFEGDLGGRGELVQHYADKITAARPARLAHLERYMLLIDDLPGAAVDGSLNPLDSAKGEFELVMRMSDRMLDGSVSVDNRGTRAVGRYQALLNANLNTGALGGTRTGVTLFTIPATPEELVYVQVTQEHRIGSEGLRGWISASHSVADVGAQYDETNLGNKSTRAVLGLAYPLIRSRDHNLEISARFDVANQRQDDNGVREFDDRLRVLRLGADYSLNDGFDSQNGLSLELSRGLDILGASEGEYPSQSRAPSRTNGRAEFTKLTLSANRRQKIGKKWAVQLSMAGQRADRRLLSSEEFYLGGTQYGRAFDSGEISGDHGAAAAFEVQYGEFLSLPYLDSYQVYGFYDFGVVWETEATDFTDHASLSSAGGGVRLGITKSVFAGFEVAAPLTRVVANENDKEPRFFFYLLANR